MRRLLLCSYFFPPIGGAGAQRPTKFARYLPEVGYQPLVLTGPGGAAGRWAPADSTLEHELPAQLELHRVPGPEPADEGLRAHAERWLRTTSPWTLWWQQGVISATKSVADVDAIWTIMTPYSSAQPSAQLSRALGCPWVADLGDPWALDEMMRYPTRAHLLLERARMRRALTTAAAIVMSTNEAARRMRDFMPDFPGPIVTIGNGYDEADFAASPPPRTDGKLRIVHTGYLHTEQGLRQRNVGRLRRLLGGEVATVDVLTRSHVYLIEALERLRRENPRLVDKIELHLAGVMSPADLEVAARSPFVRIRGYLNHLESIALMRSADLLFLPLQNLPPGRRAGTVPGKTYEYLAADRPILAALPPGDARDLVTAAGAAYVVGPDDTEGMVEVIRSLLADRTAQGSVRDMSVVAEHEYRSLVRRIGDVLDQVARP